MTDSSWDPSPNTGASPSRASLNSLSTSRSRSPYTVGGRTMVQGNAIARTSSSAASLLWPYGVIGDGGRGPSIGAPRRERRPEHDPPRRLLGRGFQHVGRAVAIGPHELVETARADASRDVVDHLRAGAAVAQGARVVQVALHQPNVGPPQRPRLGGCTDQTRHRVALGPELPHQVRTDEARPAGDERPHSDLS